MAVQHIIDQRQHLWIDLRHRLHRTPELAFAEHQTAAIVRAELDALGIAHVDGVEGAPTATIACIGDASKPCVALRADIDALPIVEQTGLPYASANEGRMHACGHDGHMATLVGAASVLKTIERDLPVCVKLIFQPAEEGGGGARRLVEAGALDGSIVGGGPAARAIFGLHGWPALKVGMIATKPGILLASTDNFRITFAGKGCHAAYPHFGRDPIVAACEATLSLQQIVSRETDPTDSVVVTVSKFNAGTAVNVIADEATIEGTVRTLNERARQQVEQAIRRRCDAIASAGGCAARVEWQPGYPPTVNDPSMSDFVAKVARQTLGPDRFLPVARPSMGAEDFAYYLQRIPGCFFLVGIEPEDRDACPSLHNDRFDFADAAIAVGVKMFVALILQATQVVNGMSDRQ